METNQPAQPLPAHAHAHEIDLEGALEFVNTRELSRDGYTDQLPDLPAALRWLHERQLLHRDAFDRLLWTYGADPKSQAHVLLRIRRLRQALREVLDATVERRLPAADAIDEVNHALRGRYVQQLVAAANGVSLDHRHEGDPVDEALSRLAEPIAQEVAGADPERLRICANEECRWVFKDESPTGRRKWCSMAVCGNRAKVARHRQRQRSRAAGQPPPE